MKINNLSLPHPVLGVHDDVKGRHDTELQVQLADNITLQINHILENASIQSMISNHKASFCTEVNCPKTFYRNVFFSDDSNQTISITSEELRDKVLVDFYVVTRADIEGYKLTEAHEDYKGYKFNLMEGDVISYGKSASFLAEKSWLALKTVSTFLEIRMYEEEKGPIKIDLSSEKIIIWMSKSDYDRYHVTWNKPYCGPVFHSAIVFPALMYTLSQMIMEGGGDLYGDKKWFQILDYRLHNDEELSKVKPDHENIAQLAQLLLNNPLDRTLSSIEKMLSTEVD